MTLTTLASPEAIMIQTAKGDDSGSGNDSSSRSASGMVENDESDIEDDKNEYQSLE